MKRIFFIVLAVLLSAVCVLSACENSKTDTDVSFSVSANSYSQSDESSTDESSRVESSDDKSDANVDSDIPEDAVKLLYTRYTQSPTFVMIGRCALGAQVTAKIGEESLTVDSYMGWFEMSFTKKGSSHKVTFTQTVDGVEYDKPRTYYAKPVSPSYNGTRAIGSNKAFQFFLEKMLPDFQGNNLYRTNVIDGLTNRVKSRLDELRKHNSQAEIIYMIVPSPMTIYPELVPERYTKGMGQTRLDQVTDGLEKGGAKVIDLRNVFNLHKNDEMPLYYKLDSHWADYGAYIGYRELFEYISKRFPSAKPREVDEFTWTADYYISADACLYLGIPQELVKEYGYYREFDFEDVGNITSVPRYRGMQLIYNDLTTEEKVFETNRSELPSCVVYRDSYCAGIYDILPERMNKTHYVGMWNYTWQRDLVQKEQPDYVIYLIAEWNMDEIVYN